MHRAYVASKTDNAQQVKEVMEMLDERDVEITFDWTAVVANFGGPGLKGQISDEDRRTAAYNDMEGVLQCDIFILLCYPGMCGALIEFGMAAVSEEISIIVVGKPERDSVFFEMDNVTRVEDIAGLEDHLENEFGLIVIERTD